MDLLPLLSLFIGGLNLAFILKLVFNDLRHLSDKLDRHLELSEQLHRDLASRLAIVEVSLLGKRGRRGSPGATGATGPRGLTGPTGPTGLTGPASPPSLAH